MVLKCKGIRMDKKGFLQLDKRCKEHYYYNQPERSKREDPFELMQNEINKAIYEWQDNCIKEMGCGALNSMET
jgi:hypothetical protein